MGMTEIEERYFRNLTDPDYLERFQYPERVGVLAAELLDNYDIDKMREMFALIDEAQAEWPDWEEENYAEDA